MKCYDVYRANPSEINKIIYHRALAKKKKYFKKAKAASWKNYVSKINKDTPTSSVWNKIRKLQGKYVPQPLPSLVVNNSVVSDPKEVSDFLAKHFSKISSEESFSQDFRDFANEREYLDFHTYNSEYYNVPFSVQEQRHALQHSKNSNPGKDTIYADIVKKTTIYCLRNPF